MKKINKYILALLIVGLFFSSCEKFLEVSPIDSIGSDNFYQSADEVEAGIIAIYDGLQNLPNEEFAVNEMRSDNSKTRTSEGEWAQFETLNVDPTNGALSSLWSDAYNVIFRANSVLPHLDVVTDKAAKASYEGEIYFLRALVYFNMVRLWGDLPIIDKVIAPEDKDYFARKPVSAVYDFIVTDLTHAVDLLPTKSSVAEGRATKAAAQALLAKVYLTLNKYAEAKALLEDVINSGDYSLEANYNDVFYKSGNNEVIFGVNYITGDNLDGETFSYAFSPQGRAGGLNWPTDNLFAAIDTTNDLRTSTLFYWNPSAGSSGDWACGKYLNADNLEYSGNTWVYLRYADVYLMYAEAVLAGGTSITDGTALGYVNAIRSRAGLADLTQITPANLLLERRAEFALENQRLFDLLRFGKASEVLTAFGASAEGGFSFDNNKLLLPIPQREINVYSEMKQNPGY